MKVKIISNELTKVYIDGNDISRRLTKVNVEFDEECYPIIKLELLPDELKVEGNFEVLKKIKEEKKTIDLENNNVFNISPEVKKEIIDKLKEKILKDISNSKEKILKDISNSIENNMRNQKMEKTQFNFGDALNVLKAGGRVARKGWDSKGAFLYLTKGSNIPFDNLKEDTRNYLKDSAVCHPKYGGNVIINAHIDMKTADGSITIGWNPSQVDMIAEDWEVVE